MDAENRFIGYEYRELSVQKELESLYADACQNFGWTLESAAPSPSPSGKPHTVTMKFKRDRKLCNKAELTRLQRQFDACAGEIAALEHSKITVAAIAAFTIGLIGCAFLAGSVFAVTAEPPRIILCAVLAVPGFLGWILPYFCFCAIRRNRTSKINPLIEKKYDELYDVCEKAHSLLR